MRPNAGKIYSLKSKNIFLSQKKNLRHSLKMTYSTLLYIIYTSRSFVIECNKIFISQRINKIQLKLIWSTAEAYTILINKNEVSFKVNLFTNIKVANGILVMSSSHILLKYIYWRYNATQHRSFTFILVLCKAFGNFIYRELNVIS